MIACISPDEGDLRETINTLRYADSVKSLEKPDLPEYLKETASLNKSGKTDWNYFE